MNLIAETVEVVQETLRPLKRAETVRPVVSTAVFMRRDCDENGPKAPIVMRKSGQRRQKRKSHPGNRSWEMAAMLDSTVFFIF